MAKHADHEQIAGTLRDNSPHWLLLEVAADRGKVSGRSALWNSVDRRPPAFRGGGFEFRTRRVKSDDIRSVSAGRYLLEGRYIGTTPAPY